MLSDIKVKILLKSRHFLIVFFFGCTLCHSSIDTLSFQLMNKVKGALTIVSESVKMEKLVTKIFFSDNVEWSSKNLWKVISAEVKAKKTTRNKRSGGCILKIFLRNIYLQNFKYNVKRACIFHLILVGILSILILSVKNREWGRGGFT